MKYSTNKEAIMKKFDFKETVVVSGHCNKEEWSGTLKIGDKLTLKKCNVFDNPDFLGTIEWTGTGFKILVDRT